MGITQETKSFELWFVVGSQNLYGPGTLAKVSEHAAEIARGLDAALPLKIELKPTAKSPQEIFSILRDAEASPRCAGVIAWMHTFSPAKMWIEGLGALRKPLLHLHTQYEAALPWSSIDMDFMNLNQSAHGDREFGHICAKMGKEPWVVAGHRKDPEVVAEMASWARAALGTLVLRASRCARFGDNMREVAVTEGDKVSFQMRFGASVDGYGVGELVAEIASRKEAEIDALLDEYDRSYLVDAELGPKGPRRAELREAARIEAGLRSFLEKRGYQAFTTTFEDLHGLPQLPGLAVQRLMAEGYGFGAEGDWKTALLVRAMKAMSSGLAGGTSFMEDYTYHLSGKPHLVLGAHMLEVCPSVASGKPRLAMLPLGIGGKSDPARLIFDAKPGRGVNASLIDLGGRYRLLVNPCEVVSPPEGTPALPVAKAVWNPEPDLKRASTAWIHAGGAHHTGFSTAIGAFELELFARITGIECVSIDAGLTSMTRFLRELEWGEAYWSGLKR